MFYCKEVHPGDDSSVWNVTNAEKLARPNPTTGAPSESSSSPLRSLLQHDFITGFDESIPYTGTTEVKYWDDKATGYPVKLSFGGKDFADQVRDPIELPEPMNGTSARNAST